MNDLNKAQELSTGHVMKFQAVCDICGAGLGGSVKRSFCRNCKDFRKYLSAAQRALSEVAEDINTEESIRIRKMLFNMANSLPIIRYSERGKDGRFCK